jgi:hypothetical protein
MRSDPIIESLLHDTAGALRIANHRCDGIRVAVYLFLCRAYEARLSSEVVCDLLGVAGDCVLNRACLDECGEEAVLDAFAIYDAVLRERYAGELTLSPLASSPRA